MKIWIVLIAWIIWLPIQGQKSMSRLPARFSIGFGLGDMGYYMGRHPTYIVTTDKRSFQYSVSWSVRYDQPFWLSERFECSIGISHLTLTEKPDQVASPTLFDDHLLQGFFHVIPGITMRLHHNTFRPYLGVRVGTANFIGSSDRETSNTLGKLNADLAIEFGVGFCISKRFRAFAGMIQGLSKYDFFGPEPVTYYQYHTFQGGITYQFYGKS